MIDLLFINMCSTPGVHPKTTSAIIKHESAFKENALNINTRGMQLPRFDSKEAAILFSEKLYAEKINFDVGLMQVNSVNFRAYGLTVRDAFDPCRNIRVGTEILKRFYEKSERELGSGQDALKAALSAYNTGNGRAGFENGYVAKFYGQKVAFSENPYKASMVPTEIEGPARPKKKTNPYTISMVPDPGNEGAENAEPK